MRGYQQCLPCTTLSTLPIHTYRSAEYVKVFVIRFIKQNKSCVGREGSTMLVAPRFSVSFPEAEHETRKRDEMFATPE
jgi:hypothetical protein